jgi:hypothetical protein
VKIGQLADSSWINLRQISFFVSFFQKKKYHTKGISQKIALLARKRTIKFGLAPIFGKDPEF